MLEPKKNGCHQGLTSWPRALHTMFIVGECEDHSAIQAPRYIFDLKTTFSNAVFLASK